MGRRRLATLLTLSVLSYTTLSLISSRPNGSPSLAPLNAPEPQVVTHCVSAITHPNWAAPTENQLVNASIDTAACAAESESQRQRWKGIERVEYLFYSTTDFPQGIHPYGFPLPSWVDRDPNCIFIARLAIDYPDDELPLTSRGSQPQYYRTSGQPGVRHSRWVHILAAMDAVMSDCVDTISPLLRPATAGWALVGGEEGRPSGVDGGSEANGSTSLTSRSGSSGGDSGSPGENQTAPADETRQRGQIVVSFWPRGSVMDRRYGHID